MTKTYKVRQLTTNNFTGDAFGITIPRNINNTFSGVSFNIASGQETIHSIECEIVDKINTHFKQIVAKVPSEFYPDLKYHQLEIREYIIKELDEFKQCIILSSGCK